MTKLNHDDAIFLQECRERAAASPNGVISRTDIYDIFMSIIPYVLAEAERQGKYDDLQEQIMDEVIPGLIMLVGRHGIKVEE